MISSIDLSKYSIDPFKNLINLYHIQFKKNKKLMVLSLYTT